MKSPEDTTIQVQITPIDKQILKQVWTKMRTGETLEGAAIYIGRSMAEHPQWFALFEALGILEGDDELPDGTNPYVHLTLHILVGGQIFHGQPKQATRPGASLPRPLFSPRRAPATDTVKHGKPEEAPKPARKTAEATRWKTTP